MVSSSYLLAQPARPWPLKRFLDQRILPAAIDGAAQVDKGLVCAGRQIRAHPALFVGLLVAVGLVLAGTRAPRRA